MKKKKNLLLNSFCFNNKLEKKWHKRLDVNNDDIIFKKLMNRIILLFQIFNHHHMKIIQILILQKIIGKLFIVLINNKIKSDIIDIFYFY